MISWVVQLVSTTLIKKLLILESGQSLFDKKCCLNKSNEIVYSRLRNFPNQISYKKR